jgi:hypothetical protein
MSAVAENCLTHDLRYYLANGLTADELAELFAIALKRAALYAPQHATTE